MLKVLTKFAKVLFMLSVLIVINPHRALLIPLLVLSAAGSWVAWRLESLCQWTGKKVEVAREKFWMFGKPLDEKISKEIEDLNRMVKEVERKRKAN